MPPGQRGADYGEFKRHVEEAMFACFETYFPELAKLVVFRELATPLSIVATTGHHEGAFYGLDVTPERVTSDALRAETPFEGLYLAGQDVASPGVPGALWGGLLAAASVDQKVLAHVRGWGRRHGASRAASFRHDSNHVRIAPKRRSPPSPPSRGGDDERDRRSARRRTPRAAA